jgi:predicted RND superfamily exporter protein
MNSVIAKIADSIIRYRIGLLTLCILLTLFFLYTLKDLRLRANLSDSAPKNFLFMTVLGICHYTIYFLPTLKFLYRIKIKNDIKNTF